MYFSCSLLLVLCCVSTFMFVEVRSQCSNVLGTRAQSRTEYYSATCRGWWGRRYGCTRSRVVYQTVTFLERRCIGEYYTAWFDHDNPSGRVDTERIEGHRWRYGDFAVCKGVDEVVSAECRVKNGNGALYPNIIPHNTLRAPYTCSTSGLFCWNDASNRCLDYEVRYKCRTRVLPSNPRYNTRWFDHPASSMTHTNPRWTPGTNNNPCNGNDEVVGVTCRLGTSGSSRPCGSTNLECWRFPCLFYQVSYTCMAI